MCRYNWLKENNQLSFSKDWRNYWTSFLLEDFFTSWAVKKKGLLAFHMQACQQLDITSTIKQIKKSTVKLSPVKGTVVKTCKKSVNNNAIKCVRTDGEDILISSDSEKEKNSKSRSSVHAGKRSSRSRSRSSVSSKNKHKSKHSHFRKRRRHRSRRRTSSSSSTSNESSDIEDDIDDLIHKTRAKLQTVAFDKTNATSELSETTSQDSNQLLGTREDGRCGSSLSMKFSSEFKVSNNESNKNDTLPERAESGSPMNAANGVCIANVITDSNSITECDKGKQNSDIKTNNVTSPKATEEVDQDQITDIDDQVSVLMDDPDFMDDLRNLGDEMELILNSADQDKEDPGRNKQEDSIEIVPTLSTQPNSLVSQTSKDSYDCLGECSMCRIVTRE